MNSTEGQNTLDQTEIEARNFEEASFRRTIDSVEAAFSSKLKRLAAVKSLAISEVKLSLGAILLSAALVMALLVIFITIWALINWSIGLMVYSATMSIVLAILTSLIANITLGCYLIFKLKSSYKLIGLPATLATLENEND